MDVERQRERMLRDHLARRGIRSANVLAAFAKVRREDFVVKHVASAYEDRPLPIGEGQTISQPYIVALTMDQLELRPGCRALEIGTGSGYSAALLAEIAGEVHTVERLPRLAEAADERLSRLGYTNVHVHRADGTLGWPARAPYDAIAVTAAGPVIPSALREQLAPGGHLVIPVGERGGAQVLVRVSRRADGTFEERAVADVQFVPLIGDQGFQDASLLS